MSCILLSGKSGIGMSGQDVVRAQRDKIGIRPVPSGLALDLVLSVVAFAAVALCLVLAARWILAGPPPVAPPDMVAAVDTTALTWTDKDSAACESRARVAAAEPLPHEMELADSVITGGGFATIAARVTCRATIKAARLCDPAQKADLVAQVNDYVTRHDLIVMGLDVQGAPMTIIGAFTGGEVAGGAAMYDMIKADTLEYIAWHHDRLLAKLHALAQGGVLSASDFSFMGLGLSPALASAFADVKPTTPICS